MVMVRPMAVQFAETTSGPALSDPSFGTHGEHWVWFKATDWPRSISLRPRRPPSRNLGKLMLTKRCRYRKRSIAANACPYHSFEAQQPV